MKLFGRKKTEQADQKTEQADQSSSPATGAPDATTTPTAETTTGADLDETAPDTDDAAPTAAANGTGAAAVVGGGPLDSSEVDGPAGRVDLGGIWLPARQGMELRLEVEEKTKRVIAATVAIDGSSVQLQAFAAPRNGGLWDEVRREIAESVAQQGGSVDDVPGTFGRELLARLPGRTADGRTGHQPARFVGFDGPRWFLRAVFTGRAAAEADQAAVLEDLVRGTVVVRGQDAMAPREMLPLALPPTQSTRVASDPEAVGADGMDSADMNPAGGDPDVAGGSDSVEAQDTPPAKPVDPLQPFERGPEITETR